MRHEIALRSLYVPSDACVPYLLVRLWGQFHSMLLSIVSGSNRKRVSNVTFLCFASVLYPPNKLFWWDVSQMLSGQGVDPTLLLRRSGGIGDGYVV